MKKRLGFALVFLVAGSIPLINSINNPHMAAARVPDYLRLIAVGMFFGLAIAVVAGRFKFPEK